MKSSRIKVTALIAIVAIFCFTLGFTTATSIQKTNWLGYLVHGDGSWRPAPDSYGFKIYPLKEAEKTTSESDPMLYSVAPTVIDSVIIGLREDGVVVWKKADESSE